MSAARPASRGADSGWQLILADLALILFLVTLTALPLTESDVRPSLGGRIASPPPRAEIAAAQALYRPVPGGPSLGQWLAGQPRDPRATLTVFARHAAGDEAAAWTAARDLAASARGGGVPVRIIIAAGSEADLYASLAYDMAAGEGAGPAS
jgi:hypothetical protein